MSDLHIHTALSEGEIPLEVVDLHGGKILVQSEPNKGSLFSILLPIRENLDREEGKEKAMEMS